jgi:hypothetical protein
MEESHMDVVDLLYKERQWNRRVFEAGEMKKFRIKRCDHSLFGLLGFFVGFLVCYISIIGLIYISF